MRPEFRELEREFRMTGQVRECGKFKPTRDYRAVGDLRETHGISALLHLGNKHNKSSDHKIEILDSGEMGFSEIEGSLEKVICSDSRKLQVMRADTAADVSDIPVAFFKNHCRAKFKRFARQIEPDEDFETGKIDCMGTCGVETVYFGKRPSCYRIYNKLACWRHDLGTLRRKLTRHDHQIERAKAEGVPEELLLSVEQIEALQLTGEEVPLCLLSVQRIVERASSLEAQLASYSPGAVLTRVERQMGGAGRIPLQFHTVGKIRGSQDFNPFNPLEFTAAGKPGPSEHEYKIDTWMAGMYLRDRIECEGFAATRTWLNRATNGHGARTLKTYQNFSFSDGESLTSGQLFEIYRDSLTKQLAA